MQQAAYDFRRQRNPRTCLLWETDLSFQTHQVGAIVPFGAREEIGAEYHQDESSFYVPQGGWAALPDGPPTPVTSTRRGSCAASMCDVDVTCAMLREDVAVEDEKTIVAPLL